jgi:hypothetical protein
MFNEHENYEEELEVNTSNLDEESKVLKKNFIKILIELVISSLVYLISSACSKMGIITSGFEVQNMIILKYAHYIMIVAYILSIIGIILLILQLLKIQLPKIKINLSIEISNQVAKFIAKIVAQVFISRLKTSFISDKRPTYPSG